MSKNILKFEKVFGKGKFRKIQWSICNIPIEAENICNALPWPAVSNGLIVAKSKQVHVYRGHVYFEPVDHTLFTGYLCIRKLIINSL